MTSDCDLLRQYADRGDETAFAQVVRRQADLVYSVALRVTTNSALAEEVTQTVFTLLARRAEPLSHYDTVVGWLHTTTRNTAINAVRGEVRRRAREQEAVIMQITPSTPEMNWEQIGPLLDEAVGSLHEDDRKAVLLRFFKNQSHQEVGTALGLSEDTARKRVERALEKLRGYFASRGVKASSALLATALTSNSVQAAPVGLAEKVTPISLAGVGGASIGSAFLLALIMSTKTKTILAIVVILAIAATLAIKLSSSGEPLPSANAAPSAPAVAAGMPKAATLAPQVTAPVIPAAKPSPTSVAQPDASAASATASIAQARSDLKTYVPMIIHYLETEDFTDIVDCVLPSDEVAKNLQGGLTREQLGARLRQELEGHGGVATLLNALRSIEGRDPDLDPTGTQGRYKLDVSFMGHDSIDFTKKDGLWYGPN